VNNFISVTRLEFIARLSWLTLAAAAWLAAAGCTAVPSAGRPAPSTPQLESELRVMTFNIRYGTAPDGEDAWPLRRSLVSHTIREFAPDVLGVQEALRFQLDEIVRELPHLRELGVGRDDGIEAGEYSAILFDRRRLDPIDSGTFWLSDAPEVPGSMTWGNRYPRVVTWARFRDRARDVAFVVFNTHWDHESQPARERGAALVVERMREVSGGDPVILMGDFNAGEENPAFRVLVEAANAPLYDTFRVLHPDARDTGTYHAFAGDRSGAKIDAILASPEWRTLAADIVLYSENGRFPSDHFPVTAILVLKPGAGGT
jgi:endonuclease/exonuclease/phosphatase family metal-dependent hydrolase